MHKGGLCPSDVGIAPYIFHFFGALGDSIFMIDNEHANQGSQCSSLPMYTLVVQNVALSQLGGAQDKFACPLSIFFCF